eukprot:Skav229941  [mRNA]  locus=scaffold4282:142690:144066:- [translate_table: standard]
MVVHALDSFAFEHNKVGMHGDYGRLNVNGKGNGWLNVTFRDFETDKPAKLSDFTLTFFDIDTGYRNSGLEAVTIEGDWSMAVVAKDTTVLVHHTEENERRITFEGSNQSAPSDDPDVPHILDLNQYNKAVTVRFQHANNFLLGLQVKTNISYARVFEFIGYASVLCASSPNKGEVLPIGQVYVNEDQLHDELKEDIPWWWIVAGLLLWCCVVAMILPFCLPEAMISKTTKYRQLAAVASAPPPKQGPGLYDVVFKAGPGAKLGLHLDAPEGLGVPPMIKKINAGAVETFNKEDKPNAIAAHDVIVKVGDVSDPDKIMEELKKGLPEEARLTLDRPYHIETTLHGTLGVKLDSLADSYGAVIVDIEAKGSIAEYNKENPTRKMNKGDRIVSVNEQTFDPKHGWTLRPSKSGGDLEEPVATKNPKGGFGSRQNSRLLEEMHDMWDKDVKVVMLKFTSNEK